MRPWDHAPNDLIARSFASAGVPVTKEPIGLLGSDGKRPDWSHTGSVAKRQVVVLGRHSILPSGWVICYWSRPWGRGGSRIGGHSQGGKVRGHCWTSHVWTNSRWNPGRFQCVSHSASEWSWQEDLLNFWWHQRDYSFVSASFGAGTAFQCCSATRQPAGPWLHGLSIIPFKSFSSIFKTSLGNRYRGQKNNNEFIKHYFHLGSTLPIDRLKQESFELPFNALFTSPIFVVDFSNRSPEEVGGLSRRLRKGRWLRSATLECRRPKKTIDRSR